MLDQKASRPLPSSSEEAGFLSGPTSARRTRSVEPAEAGSPIDRRIISRAIHVVENAFLLLIAVFTIAGMLQEVYTIVVKLSVALEDLLLMFIYVEVLAMVGAYYESKRIPITLPLFIAITAIARLTILQGKEQPPINLILEAGAILTLALASVVIGYRGRKRHAESTD